MVGVAEHVAGAVDAGPLAVPDAEHAVIAAVAAKLGLLRAPQCGGGKVLVQTGLEDDVVLFQEFAGARQRLIEIAERRSAIAGDVAGRVQPARGIHGVLDHRHADHRLAACHIDAVLGKVVFVVEVHLGERHGPPFSNGSEVPSRLHGIHKKFNHRMEAMQN